MFSKGETMKIMQNSLQYSCSLLNFMGEASNTQLENRCGGEKERERGMFWHRLRLRG